MKEEFDTQIFLYLTSVVLILELIFSINQPFGLNFLNVKHKSQLLLNAEQRPFIQTAGQTYWA